MVVESGGSGRAGSLKEQAWVRASFGPQLPPILDLNHAKLDQLAAHPFIGRPLAAKLIKHRRSSRIFTPHDLFHAGLIDRGQLRNLESFAFGATRLRPMLEHPNCRAASICQRGVRAPVLMAQIDGCFARNSVHCRALPLRACLGNPHPAIAERSGIGRACGPRFYLWGVRRVLMSSPLYGIRRAQYRAKVRSFPSSRITLFRFSSLHNIRLSLTAQGRPSTTSLKTAGTVTPTFGG